jgi:hypothetical protein
MEYTKLPISEIAKKTGCRKNMEQKRTAAK